MTFSHECSLFWLNKSQRWHITKTRRYAAHINEKKNSKMTILLQVVQRCNIKDNVVVSNKRNPTQTYKTLFRGEKK